MWVSIFITNKNLETAKKWCGFSRFTKHRGLFVYGSDVLIGFALIEQKTEEKIVDIA